MKKILIPVSASKTQHYVNQAYVEYVAGAGGLQAMLVTPDNDLEEMASLCAGLILPGGIDVDPVYYDFENESSYEVDPEKDQFERELFHIVRQQNKPIFGICRGLQLISLEFFEVYRDYYDMFGFLHHISDHRATQDLAVKRHIKTHSVIFSAACLYGKKRVKSKMFVNSMHHQCVSTDLDEKMFFTDILLPDHDDVSFQIAAVTDRGLDDKDDETAIVEGFEIKGWGGKIVAVQWHPEELKDYGLLQNIFGVVDNKKEKKNDKISVKVAGSDNSKI